MMQRQTRRMVRLIDDLRDVSRIIRGKLELRRIQIELADVVGNAVTGATSHRPNSWVWYSGRIN
jgi:signal transduction histidine kinase